MEASGSRAPNVCTNVFRLDSNFKQARIQDINVGVDREIAKDLSLSAGYIYTKGGRLEMSFDTNLPNPTFQRAYQLPSGGMFTLPYVAGVIVNAAGASQSNNLARPDPTVGAINVVRSIGESWYNAFHIEVMRRFARGLQFKANYTLAKAETLAGNGGGDGSSTEGAFGGGTAADQFNFGGNRSYSSTDQRHKVVASMIWEPRSSIWRWVNGFRASGIFAADAGRPVSEFISVPSLPFLNTDGATYNGYGGLPRTRFGRRPQSAPDHSPERLARRRKLPRRSAHRP